ncbi:MAG: CRTAC1 family protein [Acidobacteriota bacterium]|jgi:hypothetical protein
MRPNESIRVRRTAFGGRALPILLAVAYLALTTTPAPGAQPAAQDDPGDERAEAPQRLLRFPDPDIGVESMPERAETQKKEAAETGVPARSFSFTDRLPESGIDFVHQVVDDAGRHYKAVHYDHGNGVAVADVDGDGHLDVYFTTQLGSNQLWRNRGDGTFENITETAGVGLEDEVGVTASFADTDNDGDPDLYATTVNMGNHFFENVGEGKFAEVTEESGLAHKGHSSGVLFFDYNGDGLLDLYLTNIGVYTTSRVGRGGYYVGLEDAFSGHHFPERFESSLLFENRGDNRFVDVTEAVGLVDTGWTGDAAFGDVDGDLDPDLYVLNMQGDDHYYENVDGERFVERSAEVFPKNPWGAMGVDFFDLDDDGRLDLVLTDMHSDMSEQVPPEKEKVKSDMQWSDEHLQGGENNVFGNALYHQKADGSFEEVSDAMGVETYWPWGLSTGDLDADGDLDLFITNSMSFPWRYQPNALLLNDRGERFYDRTFVLGVEPRRDGRTHVPWFDVNCSGIDRRRPVCQGKEGEFMVLGTLGSRSSVLFDLDEDGDLDIVTNEFNAAPQVLVSDLAQRQPIHWLKLRLVGTRSNRDGLGARVQIHLGDRVLHRYHDGKSGYLSQSSMPLYVGLGDAETVDRIVVTWPTGVEQEVEGPIEIDSAIEVVEKAEDAEGGPEAGEGSGESPEENGEE